MINANDARRLTLSSIYSKIETAAQAGNAAITVQSVLPEHIEDLKKNGFNIYVILFSDIYKISWEII